MTEKSDERQLKVFISYADRDEGYAEWIAATLRSHGCVVDYGAIRIAPGHDFVSLVDEALLVADKLLVLISARLVDRGSFSRADWHAGVLGRQRNVIPVCVDDTDTLRYIGPFEVLDLNGLDEDAKQRALVAAVNFETRAKSSPDSGDSHTEVSAIPRRRLPWVNRPTVRTSPEGKESGRRLDRLWRVPIEPNQYFTGRDELLTILWKEATASRPTVLTGDAGVGKTRLAAEFAHRYRNAYDVVWWVRGTTRSSLTEDISRLGEQLGLVSPKDQWLEAASKVRNWLETTERKWLIVFDNVENVDEVAPAIPTNGSGHVLITSRSPFSWPTGVREVNVDVLSEDAATEYLLRKTGSEDEGSARSVARHLQGFALALEVAASYVLSTGADFRQFSTEVKRKSKRFRRHSINLGSMAWPGTPETLTLLGCTVAVGIDAACQEDGQADLILRTLAFVDRTPLALDVIVQIEPALQLSMRPLRTLARYALIEFAADESIYCHPIVQRTFILTMSDSAKRESLGHLLDWMTSAMPSNARDPRSWVACYRLVPHVLAVLDHLDGGTYDASKQAALLHRVGKYSESRGDNRSALLLFEKAVSLLADGGPGASDRKSPILNDIAVVLAQEGDSARSVELAMDLFRVALGRGKGDSGSNDATAQADSVAVINNLAAALADAGRAEDALTLYGFLHLHNPDSGGDQPEGLAEALWAVQHNLGTVMEELGRLDEARDIHRRTLSSRAMRLSDIHPDTIASKIALASALGKLGESPEAFDLARSAFEVSQRYLGEYHPTTLAALDVLISIAVKNQDFEDAFVYAERAYGRRRDGMGAEHPLTIEALHSLAIVTSRVGQRSHAVQLLEEVVRLRSKILGPQHPKTVGAVRDLAAVGGVPADVLARARSLLGASVHGEWKDAAERSRRLRLFHEAGDTAE